MKIRKLTLGKPVRFPNSHGDVWTATWADDGELYVVSDDTCGFDRSCKSNLAVHRLTGRMPPNLKAETINPMRQFGGLSEFKKQDDGMWKGCGLICLDGVLYMSVSRHAHQMRQRHLIQEAWDGSIIKSTDHGKTWSKTPRLGQAMFPGPTFSTPMFIEYGKNGKPGPHGGDKYVYAVSSNGVWNNGSSMIMGRVPRDRIGGLRARDWEFIQSFDAAAEPTWGKRHDTARYIHRAPGKTSMASIHYVAPLRQYLLLQWYFPRLEDARHHPERMRLQAPLPEKKRYARAMRLFQPTRLEFYTSAEPWGPWSLASAVDSPEAWYNPCLPSKFISRDGRDLWMFAAGDFTNAFDTDRQGHFYGYYGLWMIPVRID